MHMGKNNSFNNNNNNLFTYIARVACADAHTRIINLTAQFLQSLQPLQSLQYWLLKVKHLQS